MREKFISSFMAALDEKFELDDLRTIKEIVTISLENYELTERCTEVVPYEVVPEAVKIYLVTLKIQGLSTGTIKLYGLRLGQFFEKIRKPLNEIDTTDIKIYLFNYQVETNISNRTLDGIRTCIGSFFKWCCSEDYIKSDPTKPIKPIKYEIKKRGYLTDEEMEVLRSACSSERDSALIELFYSTGCRVSEVCNMNIKDIDMNTNEVVVMGKGSKERLVYINARCKIAIKKYLDTRTDEKEALFVSLRKPFSRLEKPGIERIFRLLGKNAGISKHVHPHILRHSNASHSIQRGMPIENVRQILGHASLDTTMIYAETCNEQVKMSHRKCVV